VYDDPKRYDNDDIYEEDTDYEDEYETYDYIIDSEDNDENALWDDEEDAADEADSDEPPRKKRRKRKEKIIYADTEDEKAEKQEQAQRKLAKEQRLIDKLEADAEEHPIEDDENSTDESNERKLLKRELRAQALKRLEDSARTLRDFENLVAWYDCLDANRQRKERYHELFRSGDDVPLDYGAVEDGLYFPDTLNDVLSKLERGITAIQFCQNCRYPWAI